MRMFYKNIIRDIIDTKARFLSIMMIIAIGVGFFVGIKSSSPSMQAVVTDYYSNANLMDFRLLSTVGFSDEDINTLKDVYGVRSVEGSYFADVMLASESNGTVVRLHTYPEEGSQNQPTIVKGRAPQKPFEVVVDSSKLDSYELGDDISFITSEGDISSVLTEDEFTIVGFAESPMYISFDRGNTTIGNGSLSTFMLLPKESFAYERYTEVFIRGDFSYAYEPYSEDYEYEADRMAIRLEKATNKLSESFIYNNITSAQSSIDEAQLQLKNEKNKTNSALNAAREDLDSAWDDYQNGIDYAESELSNSKEQLDSGKADLEENEILFEQGISDAEAELNSVRAEYEKGLAELESGKETLRENYISAMLQLGISAEEINLLLDNKEYPSATNIDYLKTTAQSKFDSLETLISALEKLIASTEKKASSTGEDLSKNSIYQGAVKKHSELVTQKESLDSLINQGINEMYTATEQLTAAESELEDAAAFLKDAEQTLENEKTEGSAQLEDAKNQLDNAQSQYESGSLALESQKQDSLDNLEQAEKEYTDSKNKAEKEFANAETLLAEAQAALDSVPEAKWYIFDRTDNTGYASYTENAQRVDAVAKALPVFFLLVAVLVCVTTMSRLIEEKRSDIGALITLGYKKSDIIKKFLIYSLTATIAGCVIGITIGVLTLPTVIFNAYGILYTLPDVILKVNWGIAVIGVAAAIISSSAVTIYTCYAMLRYTPSTLLRPKAPKPGKRIFLERIGFLWKHFSFIAKVTARNILRYKARFFMTVIGIAGCTALVLTAFGLYNSIGDIITLQFDDLCTYDAVIAPSDEENSILTLTEEIRRDDRFDMHTEIRQVAVTAENGKAKVSENTYITVPDDINLFTQLVKLRERESQKSLQLSDNGVIVSEKLAKALGVTVDKTLEVTENNQTAEFKVDGICENYVYGYIYMTTELYEKSFETQFDPNMVLCELNDGVTEEDKDLIGVDYLEKDHVLGINFMSDRIAGFKDMIKSLNLVVVAVLICAAGLAFVVLYNLTNINIAERKREISTLKVLGFYNKETSAFIYRENILLTIIGIGLGLILGIFLLYHVISTVEVDLVMFGREIHPMSFLLSALLTAFFAALVNVVMHFRIKKIDMIESLKSVE